MICAEAFCARFDLPPHEEGAGFCLVGAGDVLLRREANGISAILIAAHAPRPTRDAVAHAMALAQAQREGPDLFLSQLQRGNLCFNILSPGELDETLQAARLVEAIAGLLQDL